MKRIQSFIVCFLLTWFWFSAPAQNNLSAYEYWFNNSYDDRQTFSINSSEEHYFIENIDVSVLPDGVNVLNIRHKDQNNLYSSTLSKIFYKPPVNQELSKNLTGYEMWFNDDYENKQTHSVSASTGHHLLTEVDVYALPDGVNILNIRYKNQNNLYSSTLSKMFYKPPVNQELSENLTGYEMWFNNDYENKQTHSVSASTGHHLLSEVDVSALPDGVNVLNIRYKNQNNLYSSTLSKMFYKPPVNQELSENLTGYEMWFNNDYENRQTNSIFASTGHHLLTEVDVSALPDGVNVLNIRYKNENNLYSSTLSKMIYKKEQNYAGDNAVTAYKYWFDDDYENAVFVQLQSPAKQISVLENLDVSLLAMGDHTLNFHFQDESELWSVVSTDNFTKTALPTAAFSIIDNVACVNGPVQFVNESIDTDTWFWDFGDGTTSTAFEPEHIFTDIGDYEVSLTATYSESGMENTVTQILTINPKYETEESVEICEGAIYTWNGLDYSTTGNYTETLASVNGCDSVVTLNLTVHPSYNSQMPSAENIMAHYPFNGNANDVSGNEHHGAANGATLTPDRFGKPDGAYAFDGVDDYIDLGDWENGGAMSFAFWARWDAFNWYSRIIDLGNGFSSDNIVICNHQDNNNIFFSIFLGGSDTKFSATGITLNQWDFYSATVDDGGLMTLYKNGIQIGQYNGVTPNYLLRTKQYIGKSNFTSNDDEYFEGAIDEIIIYDIALTAEEIQEIYTNSQNYIPPVNLEICSSLTPYSFGTQALTESGTYTETFPAMHGCDSTVTLNLTIHPDYNHTDEVTICEGETYVFGKQTLITSGEYTEVFESVSGCDSTVVLTLNVNPVYNHTDEVTVCHGETYVFGKQNLTFAGEYTEVFESASGCDSTVVLTLNVNPVYNHTDEATICQGETYVFGKQNLTSAGEYTEVFESVSGCDSTVVLTLTINPVYDVMYSGDDAIPDYLVNDTFEETALNTLPDSWTIQHVGTGANDHFIVDDPVKNGIHSFKVSGSGWAANLSKEIENIPDKVVLEGWVRAENVPTGGRCGLGIWNPDVGSWGAYWARVEFFEGNLITFYYTGNSGGYGTQYVLQPATSSTWYHIKIETDAVAGTYKVYINGEQASSETGGQTTAEFPLYTSIQATSAGIYGNSLVYFDDIRMYESGNLPVIICASETPYIFGDQELTESGTYTETFPSMHGCDSTVTLNLTVHPVYNHIDEAAICQGDTYVFGTQTLTDAGEYTEVFKLATGCDSTVILTLNVNPVYNHTDEAAICQGETYAFGTQNLTTAGEYTEVFKSVTGCDSTVVLTLSVNPLYNHTDEAVICQGETHVFGTQTLTSAGEYTEVFESVSGCDSTVVLTLNVNPVYNHTDEAIICQGETYVFGTQNLTTAGEYTEVFETVTGCDSTVIFTLTVNPVYNHTDEAVICPGDTYVFGTQTLTEAGEYTEVFKLATGCDSTVILTLDVSPAYNHTAEAAICLGETYEFGIQNLITAGEYTETFKSVTGCDSTVVLTLSVNPIYNHTDEAVICQGEKYAFGTQNLTTAGEYTEVFESATGCDSTVVLTLSVNPAYNHTHEAIICQGETYVFGKQNLTTAGKYTEVFESATGCDSTVVFTLSVNPAYNHTDEAIICQGETYVFGKQNLTTAGEFTEVFESVTGCDSTVVLTLKVNPVYKTTITTTVYSDELPFIFGNQSLTEEGTYNESFLPVNGCDSLVTLTLVIKPADVTPPVLVCQPITVQLNEYGDYKLNTADIQQLTAGTTDNKTAYDDLTIQVVPETFSCEMAGTTVPVTVTATDLKGNSSTASCSIEVIDQTPPVIICKDTELLLDEYAQAELKVTDVYSAATDACGILSVTADKLNFTSSDLGSQDILVTVTDKNNNINTCSASVKVTDILPPQFKSIDNVVFNTGEGSCETTVDYPDIQVTDNCEVKEVYLIEGLGPDAVFPVGTSVERWVAVDESGNSDTISFEIIVENIPAEPAMDNVADIEIPENTEEFAILLSNIYDGSPCIVFPLDFSLSIDNPDLLQSFEFRFLPGEDAAQLHLYPAQDASGETKAIITVMNFETEKQYSDTFNIHVMSVNVPPFVLQPPGNMEIKAGEIWKSYFSPQAGIIFDDEDDELLQLSITAAEPDTLPAWILFRNDSLLATPTIEDAGCITLILNAADPSGATVGASFTLCVTIPVGMEPLITSGIKIYPNPTTGILYIDFPRQVNQITEVEIVNSLGMEIFRKKIFDEKRLEIDLGSHISGMYILKVSGVNFCNSHKIILKTTY